MLPVSHHVRQVWPSKQFMSPRQEPAGGENRRQGGGLAAFRRRPPVRSVFFETKRTRLEDLVTKGDTRGAGAMIVARGLTKSYGRTVAVQDVSFTVRPGTVTGFLGPNGAGKSTTMRMIIGLDRPDSGRATVNGKPYHELRWPLREVGAMLEAKAFHPGRSARSHLSSLAASNDIPAGRVEEVLALTGLTSVAPRQAGKFSLGMAQRLGIAAALLGDPGVVILDEPVNGLDPEGIRWMRTLLRSLAEQGRAVLISSHLISEGAMTADQLIVIGRGRLLAQTTVAELSASAGSLEEAFFRLTDSVSEYQGRAA